MIINENQNKNKINNAIYEDADLGWWGDHNFMALLRTSINPARFQYFLTVISKSLKDYNGLSVLDVGCGGGLLTEEFAKRGFKVTGLDFSKSAISVANQHALLNRLDIDYQVGSAETLPFRADSFDIVSCCDVLEHLDDVNKVLSEISRVLKPGGVFLYDTINRTFLSKIVAVKVAQDWRLTRFVPKNLHVWDKFICPQELNSLISLNHMQPIESVGLSPPLNPFKIIVVMYQKLLGQINYAEMGNKLMCQPSKFLAISYMGYAIRNNISQ